MWDRSRVRLEVIVGENLSNKCPLGHLYSYVGIGKELSENYGDGESAFRAGTLRAAPSETPHVYQIVWSGGHAPENQRDYCALGGIDGYLKRTTQLLAVALCAIGAAQDPQPRVFVTDSQSWESSGGFAATQNGAAGVSTGGARPQTAEIIKTLGERCPLVIVTLRRENADYILLLDHEGGKGAMQKDNKFAVFNKDGDAIGSGSTRSLGNAVKDACAALTTDWTKKPRGQ